VSTSDAAGARDRTPRDWLAWHREYDDPESRLSRRLRVVQGHLRRAIDERAGEIRIVSMCAGQGRDVIGVLAEHPRGSDARAVLIELDDRNAAIAEAAIREHGMTNVVVRRADAGISDSYEGAAPAEIVLACGVFGNITDEDIANTVARLPMLCAAGATVLWTRGGRAEHDITPRIRRWFAESGFEELAFEASADEDHFRVGANRLVAEPRGLERGVRFFTFFR